MHLQSSYDCFNKYFQSIHDWNQECISCFKPTPDRNPALQKTYIHRQVPPLSAHTVNQCQAMKWANIVPETNHPTKIGHSSQIPAISNNFVQHNSKMQGVHPRHFFKNIGPSVSSCPNQRPSSNSVKVNASSSSLDNNNLLMGISEEDLDFDFKLESNGNFPLGITGEDLDFDFKLESNCISNPIQCATIRPSANILKSSIQTSSAATIRPGYCSGNHLLTFSAQQPFTGGSPIIPSISNDRGRTLSTASFPSVPGRAPQDFHNDHRCQVDSLKPVNLRPEHQQAEVIDLTADCSQESQQLPKHAVYPYQVLNRPGPEVNEMKNNDAKSLLRSALPTYLVEQYYCPPSLTTNTNPSQITGYCVRPKNQHYGTIWSGTFPWTQRLYSINFSVFGNKSFRPLQEEIINAALSHKNCFVLMPTGAGKSLTYQLPALLDEGLTVIISPLLSLIQDQVSSLRSLRSVADQVESLSGDLDWESSKAILDQCRNGKIKMLYVTPEKIMASRNVKSLFVALNECNMLSRFVIDESHCVSQWGFDFRESYSQLSCLRQDYCQVPIMALTATATPLVARHIIETLLIQGCEQFQQSFNRTNLYYEVRRKGSRQSTIADMVKFITEQFPGQSGIVYCLSKYDCESVSQSLCQHGIRSDFYHASRDINQRQHVHSLWTRNQIQVVCATVAFGMGINKRDVRFVIHFSMSKSPEVTQRTVLQDTLFDRITQAFYQESGRAGRDGLPSHSLFYYSVNDRRRAIHLLSSTNEDQTERNPEQVARDLKLLDRMTLYCEQKCQCRRSMMLEYFGEMFNRADCRQSCDNCNVKQNKNRVMKDVTKYLKAIVSTISLLENETAYNHIPRSISTIELIVRGSKAKAICSSGLDHSCPAYGIAHEFSQDDVTFMIAYLLAEGIITESVEQLMSGGLKGTLHVNDRSLSGLSQPHMLEFWETFPVKKTSGKRKSLD